MFERCFTRARRLPVPVIGLRAHLPSRAFTVYLFKERATFVYLLAFVARYANTLQNNNMPVIIGFEIMKHITSFVMALSSS